MWIMSENKLGEESSPYLLQHAKNPVNWHGWNSESLEKAKSENKPIFLSVGYSSCHWCHVMAHESFENEDIARVLNDNFINIKVDREERPDIDDIYQKACQMVTGQGGWPLSVFLTPEKKPFYTGTYFPPLDSYNRPGLPSESSYIATFILFSNFIFAFCASGNHGLIFFHRRCNNSADFQDLLAVSESSLAVIFYEL